MPELAVETRRIGGAYSGDESCLRLRHYRYAEARRMEAAADWAGSVPTIKVKLALGEHQLHDAYDAHWLSERIAALGESEGAPQLRRQAMEWQAHLEDLSALSGGYTGGG